MNIFKTYRKTSLFFLIIFILVGGLYWAVDYSHKFTPEDIASLEKQAENGDAEAMYILGTIYDLGEGVPVNYEIAKKYYELAIEKEYPEAFHRLGALYWNGDGVKQNPKTAISYFEQAAEQGSSATFVLLGLLYFYGVEVEKNYSIAFEYMQKASDLGVVDA